MRWIAPVLITLIHLLPGETLAAEPGSRERTFLRALEVFDAAKAPEDYRRVGSLAGIAARRRVS